MTAPQEATILVADDNLLFSSGLVSALKRLGVKPAVADAPTRVLARARELQPAAILINLAARSLDSLQRVQELKADAGLGVVPVVGYCGHLETDLIDAGRAAGCDRVIANSAITASLGDVLRQAGIPLPPADR